MRVAHFQRVFAALVMLLLVAVPALAGESLADIKQRGVLRIGLEGTYPPFGYQDENGDLIGYDVDIAKAVAGRMGLKPEFVTGKFEGLLAALDVQRSDVVVNQISLSDERRRAYDFSEPYTYSGLQLIIRKNQESQVKGIDDLAGKRVGVLLGTNHERWLKDNAPKVEVQTYDEDATRNQDLLVGRIDGVLNDRLIVGNVLRQYNGQLIAAGATFAAQQEAIAVRKGNGDLVAALNQALASLHGDGTLKRISEKWFGVDVTQP